MKGFYITLGLVFSFLIVAPAYADNEVETLSARDITDDSAELRGEVTDGDDVEVWFVIDDDSDVDCDDNSIDERFSSSRDEYDEDDIFELEVDDLREDRKYYYRACAEDEDGDTVEGDRESFRTDDDDDDDDDVDVETGSARSSGSYVRLSGEVTEGDDVEVWFAVDDSSSVSCSDSRDRERVSGDYDENDDFSLLIRSSRFEYGEKYYYRACAEDGNDEASGAKKSFRVYGHDYDDDYDYDYEYRYFSPSYHHEYPSYNYSYNHCGGSPSFGPFRYWDRGAPISELQRFLNCEIRSGLVVDGIYGPRTAHAAQNYKRTHGDIRYGNILFR